MPTYEYECNDCGHTYEKFQSITAKPLRKCPVCAGRVRRLIGAGGGIIFRGSGFYQTDYRSQDYQQKAKADSGTTKSSDSSEKSSSEKSSSEKSSSEKGKDKAASSASSGSKDD